MFGKRTIYSLVGFLFVGIFCLNNGAFGSFAQIPSEVVFIDPSVPEMERIVAQLPQGAEVVRLSPGTDGIAQISDYLAKKKGLSAIHIISHGNGGRFVLNGKRIDGDFLRDHGDRITSWGLALAENGDILIYACNLAATDEGKTFIENFADLTGADVAASTDITGAEAFNGNWNLEYSMGQIATTALSIDPDIEVKLDTRTWNGGSSRYWADYNNWTGSQTPGIGDHVVIDTQAEGNNPDMDVDIEFASFTINSGKTLNIVTNGAINVATGDITNNGTVNAEGAVPISIRTSGTILLNGSITSGTGSVTIGSGDSGGIVLTGASTITSTSGTVTFVDSINGGDNTLVVDAGTGLIDFQQAIGSDTPLNTLTITQSGGTTFEGAVTTSASVVLTDTTDGTDITFKEALVTPTLTTAAQGYNVELLGGCTITNNTSFLNTGTTTIGNGVGDSSAFTGGLDATAGPVSIAGTIATTNSAMDLGATTQTADSTLKSGTGAITVASMTGDYDLTLQSDVTGVSGGVTFTGNLAAKDLFTLAQPYAVTLQGTSNTIDNHTSFLNTGTTTIGNDADDSSTFTGGLDATAGPVSIAGTITTNSAIDLGATTVSDDSTINPAGGAVTLGTLTINDAKTLIVGTGNTGAISFASTVDSAAGYTGNLTVNTNNTATFSNHVGGIRVIGTLTLTAGTVSAGDKNITAGTMAVNGGTFGQALSPSGVWDVENVTIASGATMNATTGAFNVSGNWTNSTAPPAGTFNHKTGTVTLDGGNQTIYGSTTFYKLEKNIETAATLTFENGAVNQTIVENTLQLQGGSGALLSLRSSSADSQWEIDPRGTRTIAYLDVKDSKNVNETAINAVGTNSVNSGNNTNWTFPAPTITSFSPTVGGTTTSVTIDGTNFTNVTFVKFGGTDASSFTVDSSTRITAIVGSGSTGTVTVTTQDGTAASSSDFTFYSSPTTTSFSPTAGGNGTSVTIKGTNFTGATAVKFGGTDASSFTVDSSTRITAIVGGGSTGTVTVTSPGGTATSSSDFTYTTITAGTYYVNASTGSDSNDGSAAHPWKTIHHAVSMINAGGTGTYVLHVALETYSIAKGEVDATLTLSQSNVTIIGESGSGPVIDGTNATNWTKGIEITGSNNVLKNLFVTGFSGQDPVEEGIRISGGTANEVIGCTVYGNNFGIRIYGGTNSMVNGCDIYENSSHGIDVISGAGTTIVENVIHGNPNFGIRAESSPTISRNEIYDNLYGIMVQSLSGNAEASPEIKNNVIYEKTSGAMNYGIFTESRSNSVVNPRIYHNTIDGGVLSGIRMEKDASSSSAPIIKYNIITNFGQYGIQNPDGANPTVEYNDVWNNTAGNYSGIDVISSTNITTDPLYASYSLQYDSPCKYIIPSTEGDSVTLDYPGFKRPRPGENFTMGAYEYVPNETSNYTMPGGTGLATDYRIFTVPLNLGTGAAMLTAMENVLGTYNPVTWRGFLYTGTLYREFNSSQFASYTIKPGMGFWIITTYTSTIPFEGAPAPDGVDYVMDLDPGWHLIGLPWLDTSILLSSIKVTDGVYTHAISSADNNLTQRFLWDYTGTGDTGYVARSAVGFRLQNNKGYFFKVLSDKPIKLIIPNADNQTQDVPVDMAPNQTNTNEDDEEPPPPPGAEPRPDIKANGQDGPVAVTAGDPVSVSVSLDPGAWSGRNADWWVAARTPFETPWYTYTYYAYPQGWQSGIRVCVQMPLFELISPYNVLNMVLPVGDYTFYFAVDGNMDGNPDATWMDAVAVHVE